MSADQLARGLFNCLSRDRYLTDAEHKRIVETLHAYGESVRQQAVKLLEDNWYKTQSDCAAAIEKMPLT